MLRSFLDYALMPSSVNLFHVFKLVLLLRKGIYLKQAFTAVFTTQHIILQSSVSNRS